MLLDDDLLPANGTGLEVGDVVGGKYRIDAILGRGGMSVVYRATHLDLDQLIALKVLAPEALLLPGYVERLKLEARAVARIRSEHVARVHDIGHLEATPGRAAVPYLVMEHLSGTDLSKLLKRRGQLPLAMAGGFIVQACEALAEAHALGIVHRDLKPANLFLTQRADGSSCVKVLDFGISRVPRRQGTVALTDPGTVLGTPSYMAPEQMEGLGALDCRADIWALGAILFELLTGETPYGHDTLPKMYVRVIRSRTPRPSQLRPGLPADIDEVVARCLAIEPEDRYPSVAHLAVALAAVIPGALAAARRVTRVFERRRSEASGASTPALSFEVLAPARAYGRERRHTVAILASFGAIAIAAFFGGLAVRTSVVAAPAADRESTATLSPDVLPPAATSNAAASGPDAGSEAIEAQAAAAD